MGWGLGEKGEGIKKYKRVVTKCRGVTYSIGNLVNNILMNGQCQVGTENIRLDVVKYMIV